MKRYPLAAALRLVGIAGALAFASSCGGGGGGGGGAVQPPALVISTSNLAAGTVGIAYSQTIAATGGTGARTFSLSAGTLPAGLSLAAATGTISGTPQGPAGTANFTILVTDSGSPQQNDTQALSIAINAAAMGRNDSIATATTLGNGSFNASISPSGHPNTVFIPDQDYYRITTVGASTVTVDIDAQVNGSPLDPVIEIVNGSGARLNSCLAPTFNSPCMHDDEISGVERDSFLQVQLGAGATAFIRVMDWRGDARPDLTYTIHISGVN